MGYTHYFKQIDHCPPKAWERICENFRELQATAILLNNPLLIQRETDDCSEPYVARDAIIFNGIENDGHETMALDRLRTEAFSFCKTARKPYDRVVVALLCFVNLHAPGVWLISSDGDEKDWEAGLALARTVEPDCLMVTFEH